MKFQSFVYLLLFSLFGITSLLHAQAGKLDELMGYRDLKIGENAKALADKLKLQYVEATDPYSGAPDAYYVFKDLKGSAYASIFETKVQEIKVREEGGTVIGISITFDPKGSLDRLSTAFAGYYDAELGCALAVMSPEWGGCYLDGEKVSFSIERVEEMEEPTEEEREHPVKSPIHVGIGRL